MQSKKMQKESCMLDISHELATYLCYQSGQGIAECKRWRAGQFCFKIAGLAWDRKAIAVLTALLQKQC